MKQIRIFRAVMNGWLWLVTGAVIVGLVVL